MVVKRAKWSKKSALSAKTDRSKVEKTEKTKKKTKPVKPEPEEPIESESEASEASVDNEPASISESASIDNAPEAVIDKVNEADAGEDEDESQKTFADLGVIDILQEACAGMGFTKPTPIQEQSIPYALEGKDVMGIAATGSGKTAAFALPVLQALYEKPSAYFCVVLAPTRELANQISDQFKALGEPMGVRTCVIIGGESQMRQSLELSKKPHVIVATPGRLLDHLKTTKGFNLRNLKYLILDEADRLLDMDFEQPIKEMLNLVPQERHTYLFSATPSKNVERLQRASLSNPVRVSVSSRITTVDTLVERIELVPFDAKEATLVYILSEIVKGRSVIVFVNTKEDGTRIPIMLELLQIQAVPINGNMTQSSRLGALNKFKSGAVKILIATNVAARGLDIPMVDVVINYAVPENKDEYIHRVGRTARAGRSGMAITLITQYDFARYSEIERQVHGDKKVDTLQLDKDEISTFRATIDDAQREAKIRMREIDLKRRDKGRFKQHRNKGKYNDNDD